MFFSVSKGFTTDRRRFNRGRDQQRQANEANSIRRALSDLMIMVIMLIQCIYLRLATDSNNLVQTGGSILQIDLYKATWIRRRAYH